TLSGLIMKSHNFVRNSPSSRVIFAVLVVLVALSATESRLVADPPPAPEEDSPPDPPLAGSGQHSPKTVISAPFGTSFQVNVGPTGQNIVGDAANEPSICIAPNNLNRIAIGWRQFDTTNSNFRQSGVAYSTNSGLSWTSPGNLEAGTFRSDPVLASDADGVFYYLGISNANNFACDLLRSTNGWVTWQRIGPAEGGDKEWMTIDSSSGQGRINIYQAWQIFNSYTNNTDFMFTRSSDSGASWITPIGIPHAAHFGTLDVGPNGEVYVLGWDGSSQFWLSRSTNSNNSSVPPAFDLTVPVDLGGILPGGGINPGGLLGQAWLVVDRSTNQTRGNVY